MSRIALSLALIVGLPLAAGADNTFTYTTQNGTVIDGDRTCGQTDGVWTCTLTSQWTGATYGLTGTHDRTTTFQPGQQTTISVTGTRFTGNTFSRTRTRTRTR